MINKQKLEQYRHLREQARDEELSFVSDRQASQALKNQWANIWYKKKCKLEEQIIKDEEGHQGNNDYLYKKLAALIGRLSCYD